jgi:hypothetical protein
MYTARKKIQKDKGVEPSEIEETVAQVSGPSPLTLSAPSRTAPRLDSSRCDMTVVF